MGDEAKLHSGEANGGDSPPMGACQQLKKVMVFCDGTWCGTLTGTQTNVKILADAIAGKQVKPREPFISKLDPRIVGCYFDGEGVQGGLSSYLLDGAFAGKIRHDCLDAYKYVMDKFEEAKGDCEAWFIGLSRGSYTVRCVAGMINNCGLISRELIGKRLEELGRGSSSKTEMDSIMDDILQRAYGYYRARTDMYKPESEYMQNWRLMHSRQTKRPPIKFMGLFETVGSLGIPMLNPGMGVDYFGALKFFGKDDEGASAVSGEVERVYQALAVHDRLTVFTPCHVRRDNRDEEYRYNKILHLNIAYKTKERWFPGTHYDIGRQKFMFFKSPSLFTKDLPAILKTMTMRNLVNRSVSFCLTRLLRIPDIYPNLEHSWAVMTWMISKMANTDRGAFGSLREVVESQKLETLTERDSWPQRLFDWVTLKPAPLGADAYDKLMGDQYLSLYLQPFVHRFLKEIFDEYLLMDRTIVDPSPDSCPPAPPVEFFRDPELAGRDLDVNLKASKDYRSRSYDAYMLERSLMVGKLLKLRPKHEE